MLTLALGPNIVGLADQPVEYRGWDTETSTVAGQKTSELRRMIPGSWKMLFILTSFLSTHYWMRHISAQYQDVSQRRCYPTREREWSAELEVPIDSAMYVPMASSINQSVNQGFMSIANILDIGENTTLTCFTPENATFPQWRVTAKPDSSSEIHYGLLAKKKKKKRRMICSDKASKCRHE